MIVKPTELPRVGILTRPDFKSPRILAESLKRQLERNGAEVDIIFSVDTLARLTSYADMKHRVRLHFWLRQKLLYLFHDWRVLRKLKAYDAIILSECCPNAFWKWLYNVEKLRRIVGKPILLYEVYYLGNAPSQVAKLEAAGDALVERYDWHLAVAQTTEEVGEPGPPWSAVGLDLTGQGLEPFLRDGFIAVIDFEQPGYEQVRSEQIEALRELGVETVVLDGAYSIDEIRAIYKRAALFFLQFPEAFGVSTAECLASGALVATPDDSWPMAWACDSDVRRRSGQRLHPDCFLVYESKADLRKKVTAFREEFDRQNTPVRIAASFRSNYRTFFYGMPDEVGKVLDRISRRDFE